MEFWVTIAGLMRRWRVIVPALLVAVALGAGLYVTTPVTYVSSATMILTSTEYGGTQSQDPETPSDLVNPMLYFNDSLKTTSAILIEAMHTKDVATQLGVSGPTTFRVDDGRTNPNLLGLNGPFLYIVGESTSPAEAERVVQDAQTLMREKLQDWQSALKAPERTFVSLVDVVPPSTPAPNRGRATKLGVLGFIFGLGLSLGIAYLRHRTRDRRRARAVTQPAAAGPPPSGDRPSRRLGWRPSPSPVRAPVEGGAEPALVPMAQEKTEPAPVPVAQKTAEPAPVPVTKKKKNGTGRVPTSQQKNGTVPVATSTKKNGTVPAPATRKKTELALVRRSMNKKAELAAVPPTRPVRRAVCRPTRSPHHPEPADLNKAEPTLVPVPVKRSGRSRNQ